MKLPLIAKVRLTTNRQRGLATLEMLIAMTLIIVSISAALLITQGGQSSNVGSKTHQEALYKARDFLGDTTSRAMADFNLANSVPSPPLTYLTDDIYKKNIKVTMIDDWKRQVQSNVTWQIDGQNFSVALTTLLTDPLGFKNGGNTCSSEILGDWKNPKIYSYEFGKDLLIPSDTANLFPITGLIANSHTLYVTANNSHQNSNATFFMFDISDPNAKPVFLQSIDNDPYSGASQGLNALAVAGNYAYVANGRQIDFSKVCPGGACGQLQIIDISTTTPTVKTTFKIPGVIGKSGQAIGASIFYSNGYVYLGLAKTAGGPEFNIIDVHDPKNPVYKGGYTMGNSINAIIVKNNTAYIATPNSENLTILDVSDATAPKRIGGYTPKGGSHGKALGVVGSRAYLGRTFGNTEFYILDTLNPGNIFVMGSRDIGTGPDTSINGMFIRDYLAFFITGAKFEVWNIQPPTNITPWTQNGSADTFLNLPGDDQTALGCNGNYLYAGSVSTGSQGYISVITSGS